MSIYMSSSDILKARKIARACSARTGEPLFYRENKGDVEDSCELFGKSELVQKAVEVIENVPDMMGHGVSHSVKVAVDAGAIILIERAGEGNDNLVKLAHIAGVLHDIKRRSANHAERGGLEARKILREMGLSSGDIEAVVLAIRNHEAFKDVSPVSDPETRLLSNALYDADKFRWGPDNFTEMLWDMFEPRGLPVSTLLRNFLPGLEGIRRIRSTFRTDTGKRYGPDFIDRGIELGNMLYVELKKAFPEPRCLSAKDRFE